MADLDDLESCIVGVPLVEIFSIILDTNDKSYELYGTVKIQDDMGTLCVYDVELDDAKCFNQGSRLSLSDAERPISVRASRFTMFLDLKNKTENAEFIKASFTWNGANEIDKWYDRLLVGNIKGKLGSATVYYAVHSTAMTLGCVAKFVNVDGVSSVRDVYGSVVARYKKMCVNVFDGENMGKHSEIILFEETYAPFKLEHNCRIPLSRPFLSVPGYSSLSIEVKFSRRLPNGDTEVVFNDEVEVFPKRSDNGEIRGKHGGIRLIFIWFDWPFIFGSGSHSLKAYLLYG